jgi:hypothetical protein
LASLCCCFCGKSVAFETTELQQPNFVGSKIIPQIGTIIGAFGKFLTPQGLARLLLILPARA